MKITTSGRYICFVPENDVDCFDLGKLSLKIYYDMETVATTDNPNAKINVFKVRVNDLWSTIIKLLDKEK